MFNDQQYDIKTMCREISAACCSHQSDCRIVPDIHLFFCPNIKEDSLGEDCKRPAGVSEYGWLKSQTEQDLNQTLHHWHFIVTNISHRTIKPLPLEALLVAFLSFYFDSWTSKL